MKNSEEKKKIKDAEENTEKRREEQLDATISKAQDMDDKLSGLTGKKKAEPERMLPPSTSVFLNQASGNAEVGEAAPPTLDEDRERKIVEKNPALEKARANKKSDIGEPDDDLIEDHKDFERRPRKSKHYPLPPKRPDRRAPNTREPLAKKRGPPLSQLRASPPSSLNPRSRPPVRRSNVFTPTKFEPAVAGVADTNLKKCPQCGGFVNLAVSKSCFSCGYDIK